MPKTPREMYNAVRANLPKRTGVTLNEWKLLLRIGGPRESRKERIDWLKSTYGLGSVQAAVIVSEAEGGGNQYEAAERLIENQFAGQKKALLPIADKVLAAAQSLGIDVRVEPCRTYVPVIRRHQFAVVKPATGDRVDLGLALPGAAATKRLVPVKHLGTERITHRISLRSSDEVDAEVVSWLRKAYELDAKA